VRWGAFLGTAAVSVVLILFQWAILKKLPKKDMLAFYILLIMGLGLSIFDLPNMPGPLTIIEAIFKPFGQIFKR
jgi:hypothetical protein